MKKHIWDLSPDDVVILPLMGFFRLNRDYRKRVPRLGVVTIRELVSVSDKTVKQKFIHGMEVEIVERQEAT